MLLVSSVCMCIYVIMCIFERLYVLHSWLYVVMSFCGIKWITGLRVYQLNCGECVQVCECVTGRVKCSLRAAGTPDPPTTPI